MWERIKNEKGFVIVRIEELLAQHVFSGFAVLAQWRRCGPAGSVPGLQSALNERQMYPISPTAGAREGSTLAAGLLVWRPVNIDCHWWGCDSSCGTESAERHLAGPYEENHFLWNLNCTFFGFFGCSPWIYSIGINQNTVYNDLLFELKNICYLLTIKFWV